MHSYLPKIILLTSLLSFQFLSGQTNQSLLAVKCEVPPVIDGKIEELIWNQASLASNFQQFEPYWGQGAGEQTKVRILYDDQNLYLAFSMEEHKEILAQMTDRDASLNHDDAVTVILDTYHDQQSAYYFSTNLLGTQTDGTIMNDGKSIDDSWDGKWSSQAQKTDSGWTAEIAIPFASLKYQSSENQTWGINFTRSRPRARELSCWATPRSNPAQVSQAGLLKELNISQAEKKLRLIGYGLGIINQAGKIDGDIGVDVLYKITPQISTYATINPDFATVEADEAEINFTKYELSLSEKRPFFIEGNELYDQRIKTFYSRRIGDISGGAKVLGRSGPWTISGLSTVTENDSDLVKYVVGKLQHNLYNTSNVSLMSSTKNQNDSSEGSLGIDANLIFNDELGMTAQIVNSYGDYSTGNWAYFFRPSYDTPTGHFHIRYTNLGEYFSENVNGIGYIKDDDRKEFDSAVEKEFWISDYHLDKISYDSNYNIFWSQSDTLRSWDIKQSLEFEFINRFSLEFDYESNYEFDDEGEFDNTTYGLELGYNKDEFKSIVVKYEQGQNYGLNYSLVEAEIGTFLTPKFSVQYSLQNLNYESDPEQENGQIHILRANQFFTKDIYLKGFYQVDSNTRQQDVQLIFVYRYQPPFGSVQFVYQQASENPEQNLEKDQSVFLKYSIIL